ncbi:MAG: aspartyl/asparaginyl beta-hydroxylase domain-containing protein [Sphingomonadales bacterium]|jgi:hypothetical protein
MDIEGNVRHLGKVNHTALRDAVLGLKESVWEENEIRQQKFKQHSDTQSIILLWLVGWEPHKVVRRGGCDYIGNEASELLDEVVENNYPKDGEFLRAVVAKLKPGGSIKLHNDSHPNFAVGHRIHVPLKTSSDVIFNINGERVIMEEGMGYEINNLKPHEVHNLGLEDRIHLIFDYADPK